MGTITVIFQAIASFFGFATKVIPSDYVRNDLHNIKKPKLESHQRAEMFRQAFAFLRQERNWGTDIRNYVGFTYDALEEEDKEELIKQLVFAVKNYQERHPIIYKAWLKRNHG